MACSLNNPQEHLKFVALVAVELREMAKTQDAIDIDEYVAGIYQEYIDDNFSAHDAAEYAQFVPSAIHRSLGIGEIAFKVNIPRLQELINEYKDINAVKKAMTGEAVTDEEVDSIKKRISDDAMKPEELEKASVDKIKDNALSLINYVFKVPSPLAGTGQQALVVNGKRTQIRDEEQNFYYDFITKFHYAFLNSEDPTKITIGDHTGFGLKVVTKKGFTDNHLREDEKALVNGNVSDSMLLSYGIKPEHFDVNGILTPDAEGKTSIYRHNPEAKTLEQVKRAVGKFRMESGVGLIVTDVEGNTLYFDNEYNTTNADTGKPLYYSLRYVNLENGVYSAKNIQSPKEIAANNNISIEEATSLQQQQLEVLYKAREYAKNTGPINLNLTGTNRGVLNIRKEYGETRISDINWDKSDINLNVEIAERDAEELGENKGQAYVTIPGYRSIPIQSDNLSVEDINRVLDLAFKDGLLDEFGNPFPADRKVKLIEHLVYSNSKDTVVSNRGLQVYADNNKLSVLLGGKEVAEADRQEIIDTLTKPYVSKKGITSEKHAKTIGQYAFHKSESGQEFEEFTITDNTVDVIPTPIEEHIAKHGSLGIIPNQTVEGEPVVSFLNGYFTFNVPAAEQVKLGTMNAPSEEELAPEVKETASEIPEPTETPTEIVEGIKRRKGKKDLPGLTSTRLNPMKSTPEEIAKAKQWWNNNPLSKYIGYEEMFDVVNSNAWAEFIDSGIKLYAGANHTVLYHEAFHAFTQHFLSKKDKIKLYTEVSKTKEGKRVIKNFAQEKGLKVDELKRIEKYRAIEELLAEDFREYALSDGKKVLKQSPARNSIFRNILNFFKKLFGKITGKEFITDRAMLNVEDLYAQLYIGNINNYSPSQNNSFFGDTALYSKPEPVEGQVMDLNEQDVALVMDSMNGLISTIIDEKNIENENAAYTNAVFTNPEAYIEDIYFNVYDKMFDMMKSLSEQSAEATGVEKDEIDRRLNIIKTALQSFGTYEDNNGFVGFHLEKSPYMQEQVKNIDKEAYAKTQSDIEAASWSTPNNGLSTLKMASDRVLFLLNNIKKYNTKGELELNELGFPTVMTPGEVIAKISTIIGENNDSPREIMDALKAEVNNNPWVDSLLRKLGPTSSEYRSSFQLWTGLRDILYLSNQKLHSLMINEKRDEDGNITYEMLSGYGAAVFRKAEQDFKSHFKIANHPNKYIIDDGKTGNRLDTKAIVKDFAGKFSTKEQRHKFIKAIGIPISDSTKIIEGFEGKNISVEYIYDKIKDLDQQGEKITDIIDTLRADIKISEEGKFRTLRSQSSNINKILDLETKYSGNYNSRSVLTVNGDQAYEYSRMATRSVVVDNINKAKDFKELISMPEMAHLNPKVNPRSAGLTILKSIFFFDKNLGTFTNKRPGVKLRYDIADGIQNITNSSSSDKAYSVSTSNSDKYSRLLLDVYSMFLEGKPTGPTPADKGHIPLISVSNLITESENKNLYIDAASFTKSTDGLNLGIQRAFNILLPQIEGELKEMSMISEGTDIPRIPGFTVETASGAPARGLDFSTFSGMFETSTKGQLRKEYAEKGNLRSMSPELRESVLDNLTEYFNTKTQETLLAAGKLLYVDNNLAKIITDGVTDGELLSQKAIGNLAIKTYTVNKIIHNIELTTLFYGSIAQFKDFDKRNPAIDSGGRIARTDQDAINHINSEVGKLYQEKVLPETKPKEFSEILDAAIFKEDIATSVLLPEYTKIHDESLKERIPDDKERAKEVAARLDAYKNMETADAQGYISFDSYRIMGILTNRWSDQQEALYLQIVNNPESVKIGQIAEYFPVRKYQYAGALKTDQLHAFAFHKFALLPLIPTVIKGTKLEQVHNNMMKNDIDYATFQTGSKVSTIVKDGTLEADNIYLDNNVINEDIEFTKNPVYVKFLKDQLDINSEFKNKVIFSTQLRKLILEGLVEGGVPADFLPEEDINTRIKEWNDIPAKDFNKFIKSGEFKASPLYEKYKTYENKISKLIDFRKAELINEIGITNKELNKGSGDLTKLINFIKKELQHQDLSDHELEYIGVNDKGQLIRDLSFSPSASQIEKLLNAIVNNRLIRQKVNGEALVQVSNTLFEAQNPTEAELTNYGTKDLRSYRRDNDTGKTLAMEVKVALQGSFNQLKNITHNDGKKVAAYTTRKKERTDGTIAYIKELDEAATLARLNETIQDPVWLSNQDNIDMITMVGVRIPVQGQNSMEFMIVKEFLPVSAGSIIVPPAEIVAKSGSDFDVDKLTIMMPNIATVNGNTATLKESTKKLSPEKTLIKIDKLKADIKQLKADKIEQSEARKSTLKEIEEYTIPLNDLYNQFKRQQAYSINLGKLKNPTEANIKLYNKVTLEGEETYNKYWNLVDELQDKIADLGISTEDITTTEEKKISENISKLTEELNSISGKAIENSLLFGIRNILELQHNFISLTTPNDTNIVKNKDGAYGKLSKNREYLDTNTVYGENKFEATRYFEPGYNLYKHESNAVGKETLGLGAVANTWNTILNRVGAYLNPTYNASSNKTKPNYKRAQILLPHNKRTVAYEGENKEVISLSNLYDVRGENKISEIINQLMNGWVDVAKDAWIFDIQGNKQLTPAMDFLLEAGVPFETLVYFLANPLVKEYVNEQKLALSAFSKPSGYNPSDSSRYREQAKIRMFEKLGMGELITTVKSGAEIVDSGELKDLTEKITRGKDFEQTAESISEMKLAGALVSTNAKAAFLHYLEIEDMAKQVSNVKLKLSYDTSRSNSLFEAAKAEADLKEVEVGNLFPETVIQDILEESPVGNFRVAPFQLQLWGPLFNIRNNKELNDYIINKLANVKATKKMDKMFGSTERYVETYKNDLIVKMFMDEVKDFDINASTYKGLNIETGLVLDRGAAVLPNKKGELVVYTDKDKMNELFSTNAYTKTGTDNTAPVPMIAFMNRNGIPVKEDYYKFVIEREYQRAVTPFNELSKTSYFEFRYKKNLIKLKDISLDLDQDERERRILQKTYEEILRDKALDNTLNTWKLFKSNASIADQLFEIKEMHPELNEKYNIVRDLIMSQVERTTKDKDGNEIVEVSLKNVALRDNRVGPEDMNIYYNNMLELSNSDTESIYIDKADPVQDEIENKRVAQFFSNLPVIGLLQSGLNTKDSLSIMKAMPTDKITDELKAVEAKYNKILSTEASAYDYLNSYTSAFNEHNDTSNITIRRRYKDYSTDSYKEMPTYSLTKHELPVDHSLSMNFEGTFDKVLAGDLKVTTRAEKLGIEPGDVIEFRYDSTPSGTQSLLVRATSYEEEIQYINEDEWVKSEDSSKEKYKELSENGYVQVSFELIPEEELLESTDDKTITIDPMTTNQLESLIKNNPNVIFVLEQYKPTSPFDASKFKKFDNVLPIVLNKTQKELEESLDVINDTYEFTESKPRSIALLKRGYGSELLVQRLKDMWGPGQQDKFNTISRNLYKMFEYENINSKQNVIKDLIKDKQEQNNIVEYSLNVPYEELAEARDRLNCKL